ncbi:MAG: hypothetical protein IJN66_06300 [Muribaculaceae bacterium]|nr:hypothetical protein [Muribaculaceae bacterium]
MLLNPEHGLGIKHVDLWNHNVEFLEQEAIWDRPAVFIEFCPINWEPHQRGVSYRAEPLVKLHIVTDWCPESGLTDCLDTQSGESLLTDCDADSSVELLDLSEAIHGVVGCIDGEKFSRFDLIQTATNHNHEDIVESIDTYQCVAYRQF